MKSPLSLTDDEKVPDSAEHASDACQNLACFRKVVSDWCRRTRDPGSKGELKACILEQRVRATEVDYTTANESHVVLATAEEKYRHAGQISLEIR